MQKFVITMDEGENIFLTLKFSMEKEIKAKKISKGLASLV